MTNLVGRLGKAANELALLSITNPRRAKIFFVSLGPYLFDYASSQRAVRKDPKYFIYTQDDDNIPFIPDYDVEYLGSPLNTPYFAREIAKVASDSEMERIAKGFVGLVQTAAQTFREYPTIMPRFNGHRRFPLSVAQFFDSPFNCCPSLHIASGVFLDNVVNNRLSPDLQPSFREKVRSNARRNFTSVLYTKQHSLLDISFGILCARKVFEELFERGFDPLFLEFDSLGRENHKINYGVVMEVYHEGAEFCRNRIDFSNGVGDYLKSRGYMKVNPGENPGDKYFDTQLRKLVSRRD